MDQHAATAHLQVIRTLMERSAIYRRTLAPIMLYIGTVGTATSGAGLILGIDRSRAFGAWWLAAALLAVGGAFVIARRQSMQDGEPFWSPPTLRVSRAMSPPLAAGLIFSLVTLSAGGPVRWLFVLPNALFYGCAVHAAGFFMPRGMKLFGWMIIGIAGLTALVLRWVDTTSGLLVDHLFLGAVFGLLHLAYGAYLYATEPRKSAV
jgi:hypothetical protein